MPPIYHTISEINKRIEEGKRSRVSIYIWSKKEIENYLLNPIVIYRLLSAKKKKGSISIEQISEKIQAICIELLEDTTDTIATEIQKNNKGMELSTARKKAKEEINSRNNDYLSIVGGKHIISKLSEWASSEFGVSINTSKLVNAFKQEDIDKEMVFVISKIEKSEEFYLNS